MNRAHPASVCLDTSHTTTGRRRFRTSRTWREPTCHRTARAYWLREPGSGEIRTVDLPDPGPGEVLRPHAGLRGQPRHRGPGLPRRGAREPVRRDAGAVPGGRPARPGQVRLPQRRRGRGRPRRPASAAPSSASTRTRRRTSCRPTRSPSSRTACPPRRAVLAGTVETAVNALWDARPAGRRPGRGRRRRHGRLLRRPAAGRHPRRRGDARRRRRVPARRWPARSGSASRCPRDAPGDLDLVLHASGTVAGLQLSLDLLGADGTVTDLSWYGDTPGRAVASAAASTPRGSASGPARSARSPRRGAAGARTPTGWRSPSRCSPTRRSTRC